MKNIEKYGYIFLCSDATESECLERNLLGGTTSYRKSVVGLQKGDTVYLYNFNSKRLHGPFIATSEVGTFVPEAWDGEYSTQVSYDKDHTYLPIYRDQLMSILRFNKKGFPIARISSVQIDQLEQVFKSKKRHHNYDDSAALVTQDGHKVRSKGEQKIDDWLFAHRISHGYEYPIPETKRSDFYIPIDDTNGIYIEYVGLNNSEYLKNMDVKREIYKRHNLKLIEIYPKDLKNLDNFLRERIALFLGR
ncbi:MAG: hypothetical protein AB197_00585 [Parcubacteria bacterium C7867-002]|nr:MAG: hypothetical protein AB197_00585 [Parcubacteria bacterium C7867-002]